MEDYLRWKPINYGTWPAEAVEESAKSLCFAGFTNPPPGMDAADYWREIPERTKSHYRELARQTIAALARKLSPSHLAPEPPETA